MKSESFSNPSRRQFIKSAGAFALAGGSLSAANKEESTASEIPPFIVPDANMEYHICQGLNMKPVYDKDKTSVLYEAGKAPSSNLPADELHSCMGGNSCAGLGACGTGDYARQYWVADNTCGKSGSDDKWNGNGGCGVPIGTGNTGYVTTQLNSASPSDPAYPGEFIGQPVWNIARSRFEAKMVKMKKPFGAPPLKPDSGLYATSWKSTDTTYKRVAGLPDPYPKPWPKRESSTKSK